MSIKYESWFSTILGLSLNSTDTVITLGVAPTVTKGRMYIFDWIQKEWVDFTGVSGVTITWCTRNVSSTADPMTGGTGYNFNAGTPVVLVAMHDQLPDKTTANTWVGDQTITGNASISGLLSFTGTDTAWLKIKTLTTTQRDALTPANGMKIYNSTTGTEQTYYGGQWNDAGTSTVANATDAITGKVRLADQTQVDNGTDTEAGDPLVVIPSTLKVVTDGLAASLATQVAINNRRFGDGSDGAQTGALTVTGSNDTYILKQYTSFTPWANTVTITPTNCILHIKVQGNVDLTGTTFNFAGKGGWGGWGWSDAGANPWGNGGDGIASLGKILWGRGGSGAQVFSYGMVGYFATAIDPFIMVWAWGWGWGWGSVGFSWWGAGWNWGGAVIIECGGNLTFSSTTYIFNGTAWSAGDGAWGWGGWGSIITLYRGTLTGTPTVNVAWGAWGTAWGSSGCGDGWSSLIGNGAIGTNSSTAAGANGISVLQQI